MTVRELAQLRLLNEQFLLAENWVHRRAARWLLHEFEPRVEQSNGWVAMPIGVNATVVCTSRSAETKAIATLDVSPLTNAHQRPVETESRRARNETPPPFSDGLFCRRFVELLDDHLGGDWESMLDVDGLEVEITCTQSCGFKW